MAAIAADLRSVARVMTVCAAIIAVGGGWAITGWMLALLCFRHDLSPLR